MYKLYILPQTEEIKKQYLNNITTSNNSGFDLYIPEKCEINIGEYKIIDHKIKCKMVYIDKKKNIEIPTGFLLHPRSSTALKHNLILANSTGVIDMDYRGNIKACFFSNILKSHIINPDIIHKSYFIEKNTRLVQICAPDYKPFLIEIVENLDNTIRADNGFGSTGL